MTGGVSTGDVGAGIISTSEVTTGVISACEELVVAVCAVPMVMGELAVVEVDNAVVGRGARMVSSWNGREHSPHTRCVLSTCE